MPCSASTRWIDAPVPAGTVDFITKRVAIGRGDRRDDRAHGAEVGVARVRRRRADRDEQQPRVRERVGDLRREVQPLAVLGDHLGQAGLVDRDLTGLQPRDLVRIDVDAEDLAAEVREAGGRDQADIAGADDADGFADVAHAAGTLSARAAGRRSGATGSGR